ncbi:nucleoside triphosphate pyrophosphohydrolase family protein [Shewanella avicenniae]|uniref:Nucleoside triphosphate pyrophosphohydrolase family protein n=1 Tax=Shewanella avicenniae TaxID=2814294 RepID=A0ABX7QQF6_9GAMM|nr:nucleoside triphosphate pyrophosphohydrolase family protein [Shewanella avicenniae]QSX33262.1 nucleoside triphosphate pyrophosphohydrolase family protein [Shewanella avicenniae]
MKLLQLNHAIYQQLYTDIAEFRHTYDLAVADPSSLTEQQDALHTSLITEELTELAEAQDIVEQADAIVDSVYVLMGRLVHLGIDDVTQDSTGISYLIDILLQVANARTIDFISCWHEVHSSNMSKVCRTQQELDDTIAHYAEQGIKIEGVSKGGYLIAKCAEDCQLQGKLVRRGKVLKSVYYRPADLAKLITG